MAYDANAIGNSGETARGGILAKVRHLTGGSVIFHLMERFHRPSEELPGLRVNALVVSEQPDGRFDQLVVEDVVFSS